MARSRVAAQTRGRAARLVAVVLLRAKGLSQAGRDVRADRRGVESRQAQRGPGARSLSSRRGFDAERLEHGGCLDLRPRRLRGGRPPRAASSDHASRSRGALAVSAEMAGGCVAFATRTTAPVHRREVAENSYTARRRDRASAASWLDRRVASLADCLRTLTCKWARCANRRATSALARASSRSSRTAASVVTGMVPPYGLEALQANMAADRTPQWCQPPTRRPRRSKCRAKVAAVNSRLGTDHALA